MKLGDKILQLRKQRGLSQEGLGEKINVTRQTISNWELNETSPNPDQLKLLSKEFKISIDELLDNDFRGEKSKEKEVTKITIPSTKDLTNIVLRVIGIILGLFIALFVLYILFVFIFKVTKRSVYSGRRINETIVCNVFGEEHGYSIEYEENTGMVLSGGGDNYFYDVLNLIQYDDAHQIFNVIKDYAYRNGGNCNMLENQD